MIRAQVHKKGGRGSPDFFKIFPNFHILDTKGEGVGGHQILY